MHEAVCPPLLCNIHKHKLDAFPKRLIVGNSRENGRRHNPEWMNAEAKARNIYARANFQEQLAVSNELRRKGVRNNIMISDPPKFRKFMLVKYADDFPPRFVGDDTGARNLCESITISPTLALQ